MYKVKYTITAAFSSLGPFIQRSFWVYPGGTPAISKTVLFWPFLGIFPMPPHETKEPLIWVRPFKTVSSAFHTRPWPSINKVC